MLKRMMVSERAAAWAWQHGFNLHVEDITQRDADSKRALADVPSSSKSRRAQKVEELEGQLQEREGQLQQWEGQLQEREELDDIIVRCKLEVLSTHETSLDHHKADLEREWKALEDARA
jgi:hypothetical protein